MEDEKYLSLRFFVFEDFRVLISQKKSIKKVFAETMKNASKLCTQKKSNFLRFKK